jgi:hypothetical protein
MCIICHERIFSPNLKGVHNGISHVNIYTVVGKWYRWGSVQNRLSTEWHLHHVKLIGHTTFYSHLCQNKGQLIRTCTYNARIHTSSVSRPVFVSMLTAYKTPNYPSTQVKYKMHSLWLTPHLNM